MVPSPIQTPVVSDLVKLSTKGGKQSYIEPLLRLMPLDRQNPLYVTTFFK